MSTVGTKRVSSGDVGGNYSWKQPKSEEEIRMRILLIGKFCGTFIGKGGENIKKYRDKFNAHVNLPDPNCVHRVLTLEGTRKNCLKVIEEYIFRTKETPPFFAGKKRFVFEINYLANTEQVGAVIGRRGDQIKDIRAQAGGKVKIFPDCLPFSSERIVAIGSDDPSHFLETFNMVLDLLESLPPKFATRYYDPSKHAIVMHQDGYHMMGGNQTGGGYHMDGGNHTGGVYYMDSGNQMGVGYPIGGANRMNGDNHMGSSGSSGNRFNSFDNVDGNISEIAASAHNFLNKIGFYNQGGSNSNTNSGFNNNMQGLNMRQNNPIFNSANNNMNPNFNNQREFNNNSTPGNNMNNMNQNENFNIPNNMNNMNQNENFNIPNNMQGNNRNNNMNQNRGPEPNQGPPGSTDSPQDIPPAVASGFSEFQTEVKLTVPFDACGPIIGVQATNINRIRSRSGAKVELNKTPKGSKENRIFTIEGTHKEVTTAQRMMSDSYNMNQPTLNRP